MSAPDGNASRWLTCFSLSALAAALRAAPPPKEPWAAEASKLCSAACVFLTVQLGFTLCRRVLLQRLVAAEQSGKEAPLLRLAFLLFPSTKLAADPVHIVLDTFSTRRPEVCRVSNGRPLNHTSPALQHPQADGSRPSAAQPGRIERRTTMVGAVARPVRINEGGSMMSALAEEDEDGGAPEPEPTAQGGSPSPSSFRSVLFCSSAEAATVALPPGASAALLALNAAIALAVAALSAPPPAQPALRAALAACATPRLLALAFLLRALLPIDAELSAIASDLALSYGVQGGSVKRALRLAMVGLRLLVWAIAATAVLAACGFALSGVYTAWGIVGFGLTLSLQAAVKDMLSTLRFFTARPFELGDMVDAGKGHYGKVVKVTLEHTTLQLPADNQLVSIPNTQLSSERIQNFTQIKTRHCALELRVALSTPLATARRIPGWMEEAAREAGLVPRYARLESVNEFGIRFLCSLQGPTDGTELLRRRGETYMGILGALSEHGVALPQGGPGEPVALVK